MTEFPLEYRLHFADFKLLARRGSDETVAVSQHTTTFLCAWRVQLKVRSSKTQYSSSPIRTDRTWL